MKTFYMLSIGLLLIGTSLGSVGCKREPVVERTDVEERDDEKISNLVKEALGNSPTYKFPDVQVSTYRGKVQLSGFVLTADQKQAAEASAKVVPGVLEVENKISIKE